jgi:hypothetical protein
MLRRKPNQLAELLATGNGSLGSLPLPAIREFQPILQKHGVHLYHLGNDESEATVITSALLFGNYSYVVAESFDFDRMS